MMILAILRSLFFLAVLAHQSESLKDGIYRISYQGTGPCKGAFLAYPRYSSSFPGLIYLTPPNGSDPVTWELRNTGAGAIYLAAANRAKGYGASLAYSKPPCSPNVRLTRQGGLKWLLGVINSANSLYRIRAEMTCPEDAPLNRFIVPSTTTLTCSSPNGNKVTLIKSKSSAANLAWKFSFVKAFPSPPPPPSSTKVPVVVFSIEFIGMSPDSFDQAAKNKICDALTAAAAASYQSDLLQCIINSVQPSPPNPQKRTLLDQQQSSIVNGQMTYHVLSTSGIPAANSGAESFNEVINTPGFLNNIFNSPAVVKESGIQEEQQQLPYVWPPPPPPNPPSPPPSPPPPKPVPVPVPCPSAPTPQKWSLSSPFGMARNKAAKKIYVANRDGDQMYGNTITECWLDNSGNIVSCAVPTLSTNWFLSSPIGVALNWPKRKLYAVNYDGAYGNMTTTCNLNDCGSIVSCIDPTNFGAYQISSAGGILFNEVNSILYVTNQEPGFESITQCSVDGNGYISSCTIPSPTCWNLIGPKAMAFSSNWGKLYTVNGWTNTAYPAKYAVQCEVDASGTITNCYTPVPQLSLTANPYSVAINTAKNLLYITLASPEQTIYVCTVDSVGFMQNCLGPPLSVNYYISNPRGIDFDPDLNILYIVNSALTYDGTITQCSISSTDGSIISCAIPFVKDVSPPPAPPPSPPPSPPPDPPPPMPPSPPPPF